MSAKRVLIVPMRWPLAERLRADGYEVLEADTAEDAAERADAGVDAVLLDLSLSEDAALSALTAIRDCDPDPPVILLAPKDHAETVTAALAHGAFDYVNEPVDPDDIARRIVRAFEVTRLRRELRTLRDRLARPFTVPSIVGVSPQMEHTREIVRKIARSEDAPVLITGERGTGKDHIARVVHYAGARAMRPFLKVQCAASSEHRLQMELFGHEASPDRMAGTPVRGCFDEAHEGTILLDDVGALSPSLQAQLLQFLASRTFRRVGGGPEIRVDVRVVAATATPLEHAVRAGDFRSDLYYRLNVLTVDLPPLSARLEDAPVLARHFADQAARRTHTTVKLTAAAERALASYHWPGNLDELRAVMDRALMVARADEGSVTIDAKDLAEIGRTMIQAASRGSGRAAIVSGDFQLPPHGCDLEEVERSLVLQALERAGGNQTKAAEFLGVHRDQIRYRLKKYDHPGSRPARGRARKPEP